MGLKSVVRSVWEGIGPAVPGAWSNIGTLFGSNDPAQRVLPDPYEPWVSTNGIPVMDPGTPLELVTAKADVENVWRSQPHVRKVVDFIASNMSTIPLHLYDRVNDTHRTRVTDDPVARVLKTPVPGRYGYFRHWHRTLSDWLLYDRWLNLPVYEGSTLVGLQYVPAWRTRFVSDELNNVATIRFWRGPDKGWTELDPDRCLFDHGYSPGGVGLTPMETLRELLDEQREARGYRRTIFRNGFFGPAFIHRPSDAPKWQSGARDRFIAAMRKYRQDGAEAGGMPLMEDGMEIRTNPAYSLRDAQDLQTRQLSAVEVDNLYHMPPELVGDRPGNFANVDAYRQQLYRDNMGPYIAAWEQAVDAQLLTLVDPKRLTRDRQYIEANLDSKLRGSFEQRATQLQQATGGPWLSLNEARAMDNRAPVDGGDEVLRPLNMGQATQGAVDTGPVEGITPNEPTEEPPAEPKAAKPERPHAEAQVKARAAGESDAKATAILRKFFARQRAAVVNRLAARAEDWWDEKRWDKELAADLATITEAASVRAAQAALEAAGLDPADYDAPRTRAFLAEAAKRSAESINKTTRERIEKAIEDDEDDTPADELADVVFTDATDNRALEAALTLVTFASGFGTLEAARQNGGATKTWRVTSSNPRSSHAAMDGETVALDENFSNGLAWPGQAGDADEVAGCQCELEINFP